VACRAQGRRGPSAGVPGSGQGARKRSSLASAGATTSPIFSDPSTSTLAGLHLTQTPRFKACADRLPRRHAREIKAGDAETRPRCRPRPRPRHRASSTYLSMPGYVPAVCMDGNRPWSPPPPISTPHCLAPARLLPVSAWRVAAPAIGSLARCHGSARAFHLCQRCPLALPFMSTMSLCNHLALRSLRPI
jgi:hypothetical protein